MATRRIGLLASVIAALASTAFVSPAVGSTPRDRVAATAMTADWSYSGMFPVDYRITDAVARSIAIRDLPALATSADSDVSPSRQSVWPPIVMETCALGSFALNMSKNAGGTIAMPQLTTNGRLNMGPEKRS